MQECNAVIHGLPIHASCRAPAAKTPGALQHDWAKALPLQFARKSQPGDACTNDGEVVSGS